MTFVDLPYDVGVKIVSFLSMAEIVALSSTCKCLRELFLTKVEVRTGRQAAKLYNLLKNSTFVASRKPQRFTESISFWGYRHPPEGSARDKPIGSGFARDWDDDQAEWAEPEGEPSRAFELTLRKSEQFIR
jgi:hypothetical protein